MPLVATALLAYIAGLLAGFGAFAPAATALGIAASVLALVRRSRLVAGLALAAGVVVADAAERREARCSAAVRSTREWLVQLDDDAFPGGAAHATVHDCP